MANPYLSESGVKIERGTPSLDGGVRTRGERTDVDTRLQVDALNVSAAAAW